MCKNIKELYDYSQNEYEHYKEQANAATVWDRGFYEGKAQAIMSFMTKLRNTKEFKNFKKESENDIESE